MEDLLRDYFSEPIYPKLMQRKKLGFAMFSPVFDHVDDDLIDIFSSISSPLNPQPDFQPSENIPDPPPQAAAGGPQISPATVDENHKEYKKRKIIHRDVERQRRQEMSSLYSSIRSLLPQEYLKGKRSVSDHLQETVNYIKYLQKKMKGLNEKKDAMKRVSSFSSINAMEQVQSNHKDLVTVRPSWGGVEIVVDTGTVEHGLSLSTLVQVLEEEDLQMVSCVSMKINDASFYTIESKVNGKSDRDLSELQKRLTNLVLLHLS